MALNAYKYVERDFIHSYFPCQFSVILLTGAEA